MPVEIVMKPKTQPTLAVQHRSLVPLRIVAVKPDRVSHNIREDLSKLAEIGDIIVALPSIHCSIPSMFNCSKQTMIEPRFHEGIGVVRAYDVAQLVLTNDTEPAPVL